MSSITENLGTLANILEMVAIFIGVCFVYGGIMQLKKHAESRGMMGGQHSLAGPFMMILAGAILLIIPSFMGAMLLAFFGANYQGGSYPSVLPQYDGVIQAVLMFVRLIGAFSFIRGVVLLAKSGGQQSQPGTLGKALMHIFAGILCLHILGTIQLLGSVLGLS